MVEQFESLSQQSSFPILVPSRYPENIRGVALTTTSMSFQWDRVYPGFIHGIPIAYNLRVIETDNPSNEVASLMIPYPERYHYVEGLKKYTNYTIWVSVINSKGEGPRYPPGNINSTGEDGKMTVSQPACFYELRKVFRAYLILRIFYYCAVY